MQFEKWKTWAEHYWMASILLIVIIMACIGIIIHRQMEVNNCWSSHNKFRNKLEDLAQLKGKIEEKNNQALILKEQTDKILERTFFNEDRTIKGVEECQKRLREIEASTRKLIRDVTHFAGENDQLIFKYHLCNEHLTAYEASKTS